MRTILLLPLLYAVTLCAYDLEVTVDGLKTDDGQLSVGLYIDAETFPAHGKEYIGQHVTIIKNRAVITFKALSPKSYALALYHDANSNGRLDKNLFGIPTEAYSFSNGATALFGPPSFDKAKFTLTEDTTFSISLDK